MLPLAVQKTARRRHNDSRKTTNECGEGLTLDTKGQHLLVEYHGCESTILNDPEAVEGLLRQAATAAGAHIVGSLFHRFTPQGVSGVVVIEESHLSIHTWPEKGYAAIDFYTCGDCQPELAHQTIVDELKPQRCEKMLVHRGLNDGGPSMRVVEAPAKSARRRRNAARQLPSEAVALVAVSNPS